MSFREFARQLNISEGSVRKAIKAGKISGASLDQSNPKRPKIHLEKGKADWKKNYYPEYTQSESLEAALYKNPETGPTIDPPQIQTPPALIPVLVTENSRAGSSRSAEPGTTENVSVENDDIIELSKFAETAEARRVEAIAKAKTAQLDYNERKGRLVDKSAVYKELFAIGQAIRAALQGIPDKIIDELLACTDRNDAHKLLYREIAEALEAFDKKPNFK